MMAEGTLGEYCVLHSKKKLEFREEISHMLLDILGPV
jgi:hypothetical protein